MVAANKVMLIWQYYIAENNNVMSGKWPISVMQCN